MRREARPIDDATERLVAAYRVAGFPPIRRATRGADRVLREIRREIAPLRLPEQVERFWQLVDPATITVAPYPHLTSPEFALESWQMHRDEFPGQTPRGLFPVAYESHGFLFVELEDDRGNGGVVLEWAYAGSPFYVRFPTLAAYVDLLVTMIELGEFTRHDTHGQRWVEFDPQSQWEGAQAVRLTSAMPLFGFGDVREIDEDVRQWPERWLASNGLTPQLRALRGASTTIAELLRGAAAGAMTGTIRARVIELAGTGAGSRIAVDDGTGVLDVWCPVAVCTYGPVIRREFEFDVVLQPNPGVAPDWRPEHREVQDRALAGDMEGAQTAAMELYAKVFQTPAAAEATAVRPTD